MLTVACTLKSGGIYDASWVRRLRNAVTKHLPLPHRFVCLSDVDVPCERIALEYDWPGWWSKIEMFRLQGPVLAFDLDTAIVGDLSDIAGQAEKRSTIVLQDFYRLGADIGTGMMSWNDLDLVQYLFDRFEYDPEHHMRVSGRRGDQGFVEDAGRTDFYGRWQDCLPGQVVSYKVHCAKGIPEGARVVCLHGKPKFGDMPANDPVRLAWESAA